MVKSLGNRVLKSACAAAALTILSATATLADFTTAAYRLAVAEAAQSDKDLAKFYQENEYQPLWTGRNREDRDRRSAFFDFLAMADFMVCRPRNIARTS